MYSIKFTGPDTTIYINRIFMYGILLPFMLNKSAISGCVKNTSMADNVLKTENSRTVLNINGDFFSFPKDLLLSNIPSKD